MQRPKLTLFTRSLIVAATLTAAAGQDFKQYPGSRLDDKASGQATSATRGLQCQVYTTTDGFDRMYAFYKALYKEHEWTIQTPKLPSGQKVGVQWAFFILDGAKDLRQSKYWMKIQRPYIGTMNDGDGSFKDIRDIGLI